jgi:transposase
MSKNRRTHSNEFKARIALEAIKGLKTVSQIAAENQLHPVQVTQWKTQMMEAAPEVFSRGKQKSKSDERSEEEQSRLERKVGQLVVENDWLKKKCKQLGVDP